MSRFLKIEPNGSKVSNGSIPNVYIRNIIVNVGKVEVDLSVPLSGFALPAGFKIKTILCFDKGLAEKIINKQINLSQDFNKLEGTREQVISPDKNPSIFRITDSEGNNFSMTSHNVKFSDKKITKENPDHLSCIAFSYFETTNDNNTSKTFRPKTGKIGADIIFEDSKLIEKSKVHYVNDNKIYAGLFHKMPNGRLMEGGVHSAASKYLKVKSVPNSKIQDFRIFDGIEEIDIISVNSQNEQEGAQFSDIYLTRDPAEKVRFLFGIDCKEIYRKNAKFGSLLDGAYESSQLSSGMRIRSLKIFRQRVAYENNTFESRADGPPKLISFSEDNSSRILIQNTNLEGEETIGSIQETEPFFQASDLRNNFRFFSVVDHEVSEHTDGMFKYKVEIKFEDNTRSYLQDTTQQLIEQHNLLKSYTLAALNKGEKLMAVGSNRFGQAFIDSQRGKKNKLLKKSIRLYIENLKSLRNITTEEQRRISRTLINITHPISGNVDGVYFLMNLIEELVDKSLQLLTEKNSLIEGKQVHSSGVASANPHTDIIEVIKEYSRDGELYNAGKSRKAGIDCMQGAEQVLGYKGLSVVSRSGWNARIAEENKRYLGSNTSIRISSGKKSYNLNAAGNQNAFISPKTIFIGEDILDLRNESSDLNFLSFDASLVRRKETIQRNDRDVFCEKATNSEERIINETAHFFNEKSVSLLSTDEMKELNSQGVAANQEDAANYIGENSFFKDPEREKTKFKDALTSDSKTLEKKVSSAFPILSQITSNMISGEQGVANEDRTIQQKTSPINKTNEKLNLENKSNIINTMSKTEIKVFLIKF